MGVIVVLGMHRSGTSCLTGSLTLAGAFAGEDDEMTQSSVENKKGFFELKAMRQFCDQALHAAKADWWKVSSLNLDNIPHDQLRLLLKQAEKVVQSPPKDRPWVVKEPRLCFLLPLFIRVTEDPVVIHIVRNPVEVARSLRFRNGFGIVEGLALWEAYNRAAVRNSEGKPLLRVRYEDLLQEPFETIVGLLERLSQLGVQGLQTPDAKELSQFVSGTLRHEQIEVDEVAGFLTEPQLALWKMLSSDEAVDARSLPPCDRVMNDTLIDLESNETRRRGFKRLQEEHIVLVEYLRKRILGADLTDRERLQEMLASFSSQRVELEEEIAKLQSDLKKSKLFGNAVTDELAAVTAKSERQVGEINKLQRKLKELLDTNSTQSEEIAILADLLNDREAQRTPKDNGREARRTPRDGESRRLRHEVKILEITRTPLRAIRYRFGPLRRQVSLLRNSKLFDPAWYLTMYDEVKKVEIDPAEHYLMFGAYEGRNPGPEFDSTDYLDNNPDVADKLMNPLIHYLLHGREEGRKVVRQSA